MLLLDAERRPVDDKVTRGSDSDEILGDVTG